MHGERCIVWFHHSIWDLEVQMWKQSQSYFVSIWQIWMFWHGCLQTSKCVLLPLYKMSTDSYFGETALLRKQFEAQRSRTVCGKKSAKQEQIGDNLSATLFLYPYTQCTVRVCWKYLRWRNYTEGVHDAVWVLLTDLKKLRWGKQRIQTLLW